MKKIENVSFSQDISLNESKLLSESSSKLFNQINRGEVYYLKKISTFALVISNKMHNLFSNYLTVILVVDKNVDKVRESLEVSFELEKDKKLKAIICCFNTINKKQIYEQGILLGQVNEKVLEKINEKIKSILDLNE